MSEIAAITCPKCAAISPPFTRFCEKCGGALLAGIKSRSATPAQAANRIALKATAKTIRSARIALGFVAVVTLGFSAFMHVRFNNQIAAARDNPQLTIDEAIVTQQHLLFSVNYLLVAIYVGLIFWCSRNPFGACLTGLVIYVTLILINAAVDPATIVQGIIMKAIIIIALANGIKAGLTHRRLTATDGT